MDSILFLITFCLVPFLIFAFFLINKMSLFKADLISFVFWVYLVFAYLGTVSLYFGWDEYRVAIGVTDRSIIFKLLIYSSTGLIILSSTYVIFLKVFNNLFNESRNKRSLTPQVENKPLKKGQLLFLITIFAISSVVFLKYLLALPEIPLIAQLRGYSITEVKQFRSLATNDFSGRAYLFTLFFETFYTFICFAFFANYLIRKTKVSLVIFIFSFISTSFAMVYATEKAPFIWFLIGLVLVYFIVSQKQIKIKALLWLFIVSIFTLFVFYKNFMGMQNRTTLEIFAAIFSRTLTGQITPAYYYLEIFPMTKDFLYGLSLPNPGGIFPWEHYRLTVEVMNMKFSHLATLGIVGSAPTAFWGEAYANFGYFGVLVSSIYVGFLLAVVHFIFLRSKKNPINIGLYAWLLLEFKSLSSTGISNFIFNIEILSILVLCFTLNFITIRPKQKILEQSVLLEK